MDGTGLQRIEDPALANKILEKVNAFNAKSFLQAIATTAVLATIPELYQ